MGMMISKNSHEPVTRRIQSYLEVNKDGTTRVLEKDFINLIPGHQTIHWAETMHNTRNRFGLDYGQKGSKHAITYYHFCISPDPKDGVDLDTLRMLTMEWCHKFFGDDFNSGLLGSPEVAIVYHDDNAQNIPHAHIIVNNCDLATGKPIHIDNKTNKQLAGYLQELSKDLGLTYFDTEYMRSQYAQTGAWLTKVERALNREGRYSWKNDLRERIQFARRTTTNEKDYVETLETMGVRVKVSSFLDKDGVEHEDYVYAMDKNPARWSSKGYRLGRLYTREAVLEELDKKSDRERERLQTTQEQALDYIDNETERIEDMLEKRATLVDEKEREEINVVWRRVGTVPESMPIAQIGRTLRTNEKFLIRRFADYDKNITKLQYRLNMAKKHGDDKQASRIEYNLRDLHMAKRVAEVSDLLKGYDNTPAESRLEVSKARANDPRKYKSSTTKDRAKQNDRTRETERDQPQQTRDRQR